MLKKYMPVFKPVKVGLIEINEDYFVVLRDDGKKFKFTIRQNIEEDYQRGTIKKIEEME